MIMNRVLSSWLNSRIDNRRPGRRRRAANLVLETLEARSLLSASGLGGLADLSALRVDGDSWSQSHVLAYFKDGAAPAAGQRLMDDANLWKVPVAAGTSVADALAGLRTQADVVYAQPDYRVFVQGAADNPLFGDLWGLENTRQTGGKLDADIDAPEAWSITQGSQAIVVAVIDTGVDYTHPDLFKNIWINQGEIPGAVRSLLADVDGDGLYTFRDLNHTSNQGPGKITDLDTNGRIDGKDLLYAYKGDGTGGWADGVDGSDNGDRIDDLVGFDFHNGDNNPQDDNGHGTHVSGTIAALDNDVGVIGVAPNVRIMPVKFLDQNGSGDLSNAIPALNYAVAQGAQISNNSWGIGTDDPAVRTAFEDAASKGHLVIAAAGNGHWLFGYGLNNDTTAHYPSNYKPTPDTVIAVAASDHNDKLTYFSNYGQTTVDLAAPGLDILSTVPFSIAPEGYDTYSGTSMATPHVAGAAALVWSRSLVPGNPGYPGLTALEVKKILLETTDYIGNETDGTPTVTNGRLNAARALGLEPMPVDDVVPSDGMYVWDIAWQPKQLSKTRWDLGITVDVNRDANANGTAEADDADVGSATVSLQVIHDTNKDGIFGNGKDKIWAGSANTNNAGLVTFNIQRAPSGNYRAEVTELIHSVYDRNEALDNELVSYYSRFPPGEEGPASSSLAGAKVQGLSQPDNPKATASPAHAWSGNDIDFSTGVSAGHLRDNGPSRSDFTPPTGNRDRGQTLGRADQETETDADSEASDRASSQQQKKVRDRLFAALDLFSEGGSEVAFG
jgi:subtilisin family serine protease